MSDLEPFQGLGFLRFLNEKIVREKVPDSSVSIPEHLKPELEVVSGAKMNLEFCGIEEVGFLICLKLIGAGLILLLDDLG